MVVTEFKARGRKHAKLDTVRRVLSEICQGEERERGKNDKNKTEKKRERWRVRGMGQKQN